MSRHTSRAALGAATVVLCAFALAACTGEPTPIVTETPSPTASVSPSASPSPSATLAPLTDAELLALLPPDAAYPDTRGAIATARFFLEEYNRIYLTGDFRIWDALSGPDCIFCESSRNGATGLHVAGAYRDGGDFSIEESTIQANLSQKDGFWYVIFSVNVAPATNHYPDGSESPAGDGGPGVVAFQMYLKDGAWRIAEVGLEPAE